MYHMEDRDSIILAYRREGKSIREISRTSGICRKTVRKYLRKYEQAVGASATAEEMDAFLREPVCYDSSNRVRRVVTESVRAKIDGFMAKNRANMAAGLRTSVKPMMPGTDVSLTGVVLPYGQAR
jgi:transposase-like protein